MDSPPKMKETSYSFQLRLVSSTNIFRKGGYPIIIYRCDFPNCRRVFPIFCLSGPGDFNLEKVTQLMVILIPVAHEPRAKAFMMKIGRCPNKFWMPNRI